MTNTSQILVKGQDQGPIILEMRKNLNRSLTNLVAFNFNFQTFKLFLEYY